MTPQERWQAANDHLTALRTQLSAATRPPWQALALGSEGYIVYGPQGSRRNGHPRAIPHLARCTQEDWHTDRANAELIATLRNAAHGLLDTARTALSVHRPHTDAGVLADGQCAGCHHRWPCTFVEPLLNTFGIRP